MKSNYEKGKSWGFKTILKSYEEDGNKGIGRCDKASSTCKKYAEDLSIKKTKNGKVLTKPMREYYRGIADGMLAGYNKIKY